MSRLAVRGLSGVVIRGNDLPTDVTQIPIRRVWQLTDAEERRTRRLQVEFGPGGGTAGEAPAHRRQSRRTVHRNPAARQRRFHNSSIVSVSRLGLWLIALALGGSPRHSAGSRQVARGRGDAQRQGGLATRSCPRPGDHRGPHERRIGDCVCPLDDTNFTTTPISTSHSHARPAS